MALQCGVADAVTGSFRFELAGFYISGRSVRIGLAAWRLRESPRAGISVLFRRCRAEIHAAAGVGVAPADDDVVTGSQPGNGDVGDPL